MGHENVNPVMQSACPMRTSVLWVSGPKVANLFLGEIWAKFEIVHKQTYNLKS